MKDPMYIENAAKVLLLFHIRKFYSIFCSVISAVPSP